jgi:hypothetical protein
MTKQKKKAKRKVGRPKEKVFDRVKKRLDAPGAPQKIVEGAARAALTDTQIAGVLGITERTLNAWKVDPEFLSALKKGKDQADRLVVDGLFVRAQGYSITEVTRESVVTAKGVDGKPDTVELRIAKVVEKHVPADVTAQIFWLKNRQPKDWRDRREITGADGAPLLEAIEVTVRNGPQT